MAVYDKEKSRHSSPADVGDLEKKYKNNATPDYPPGHPHATNMQDFEDRLGDSPEGIAKKEADSTGADAPEPDGSTSAEADALGLSGGTGQDFSPGIEGATPEQGGKLSSITSSIKKHKKGYAAGGGIAGLIITIFVGGFLPFQLVHIKEAITEKYSSAQVNTTSHRMWRIYSRFFIFRTDGEFSGHKGGLFEQAVTNRTSQRFVKELEAKGYKIKPQIDASTGNWTGKFMSMIGPDGVELAGNDSSLWARRATLRQVINDLYPTKSLIWRNYRTTLLMRRYGWTRGRWWSDNKVTRTLDNLESRWKTRLKSALSGKASGTLGVSNRSNMTEAEKAALTEAERTKLNGAAGALGGAIDDALAGETADSTLRLNGDASSTARVASSSATAFGKSLFSVLKVTGIIDIACDIKRSINAIVNISRSQKSLQLANGALKILSLADGIKAGDAGTGEAVSEAMYMINSLDPETKKTFFASGGWNSINGNSVKPTYATTYDTGGGLTGQMATVNNQVNGLFGSSNVQETCKTLAKWYVQLGSAVVGIAVSMIPGVGQGFQAWKIAGGVSVSIIGQFVLGFATTLGIKAAAGTIVDGTEKGEKLGDMMTAGSGALFGTNASNMGMRPLTTTEYAYQQQQYLAEQQVELSKQSFFARYFNPENSNSITGKAISAIASIKYSPITKTLSSIPSLLFSAFKGNPTGAVEEYSCSQADIALAGIQTDPFCNPIMGNTDAELDKIDPVNNMFWMVDNNYVDGDGNPTTTAEGKDYANYVKNCFETNSVLFETEQEWASPFTSRCYASAPDNNGDGSPDVDSSGIGLYERFRAFRLDSSLLVCAGKIIDTGTCEDPEVSSTTSSVIVVDPGHGGDTTSGTVTEVDETTGILDHEYYNDTGEIEAVFDVSMRLKTKLEQAGYTVILTKNTAPESVFERARANVAKDNGAALGVSIHTDPAMTFGAWGQVYVQTLQSYRENQSGEKIMFTNQSTANLSQRYGEIILAARKAIEGNAIEITVNDSFGGRGLPAGNVPLVMLFSPDVPWVFMEAGNTATVDQKEQYAQGIFNGIAQAIPASTSSADFIGGDTTNIPCQAGGPGEVAEGYKEGVKIMIRVCNVQGIGVNSQISGDVDQLLNAATAAGVNLISGSGGFRTWARQAELYDQLKNSGTPVMPPGYSNHQMGLAIDFNYNGVRIECPGGIQSEHCRPPGKNSGFDWLDSSAIRWHFKVINSEAWHWEWDPSHN